MAVNAFLKEVDPDQSSMEKGKEKENHCKILAGCRVVLYESPFMKKYVPA
jgi:hypothetical protein